MNTVLGRERGSNTQHGSTQMHTYIYIYTYIHIIVYVCIGIHTRVYVYDVRLNIETNNIIQTYAPPPSKPVPAACVREVSQVSLL